MTMSISKWKWIVVSAVGSLCLTAWVAMGVGLFVRFNIRIWTLIVTAAAVSTELFFWVLAATLGVTVFQARRRLWANIAKQFRNLV
jgi:hypothetical protein